MISNDAVGCTVCGRTFQVKFSFQVAKTEAGTKYYCSQKCRAPGLDGNMVSCSVCSNRFRPSLAWQVGQEGSGTIVYYCRQECVPKTRISAPPMVSSRSRKRAARAIAVLNQKGGTGKTTTALSVAAGLAHRGYETLLIDFDPQGNVGVSLGIKSPRSIYHILFGGLEFEHATVPVRDNLDIITADPSLAAAEIELARITEGDRAYLLSRKLGTIYDYDFVIFDCAPAQSLLNYNALVYSGEVMIPVSCDYLALVGVKQVMQTLRRITEQTGKPMKIAGVVPTFFDVRKRVCVDALSHLQKTFGTRMCSPVRINTKLAEAPSVKKTIFEHAPDSNGALDYLKVIEWLCREHIQSATTRAA